jgi:hypothetical protein
LTPVLEHIRHFLQVDKPVAVSAGTAPVAANDHKGGSTSDESSPRSPVEWAIIPSNFLAENPLYLAQPVRVERVFLSSDNKDLVGSVAVINLAFQKDVVALFTLDHRKTTFEVVVEYFYDVQPGPFLYLEHRTHFEQFRICSSISTGSKNPHTTGTGH